ASSPARRIRGRLRGHRPNDVAWSHSPEMATVVERLAESADVVHVARLATVSHTERLLAHRPPSVRMVLDLDAIESTSLYRRPPSGPPEPLLHRIYGYYDLVRLWAYQRAAVRRFDRVFVCSERDRRRFARASVVVVPNGARVPDALPPRRTDGRTILFC